MRLQKLRVRNVASLRGEHTVDFKEIMRTSSLFAITGETGAGKSSILNSIALALYGEVFKAKLQQSDLVTLGEKDAEIELIFDVKGKTYLAHWRARVRKQNGEAYATPPSPTRDLYELQGPDFDDPKTISSAKIEDILHLDFDQFCKCVVLNQGEFARFLTSSFTDRKDILEKLYPGEVLDNLGRTLRADLFELERQLSDIEINLKALTDEGVSTENLEEKIQGLRKDLTIKEEIYKALDKVRFHFQSLLSYKSRFQENEKKISAAKDELSLLTKKQNTFMLSVRKGEESFLEAQAQELEARPRLLELSKKEETLSLTKDRRKKLQLKLDELKKEETHHQEKSLHLIQKFQELTQTHEGLAKDLSESFDSWKERERTLTELFDRFQEAELKEQALKHDEEKLSEIEKLGREKARALSELKAKLDSYPADLEEGLKKLQIEKHDLVAKTEAKQRSELMLAQVDSEIKKFDTDLKRFEETQRTLTQEITILEREKSTLENSLAVEKLLEAVEICLSHTEGACPVCKTTLSDEKVKALKKEVIITQPGAREELEAVTKSLVESEQRLKILTGQIQETRQGLEERRLRQKALRPEAAIELAATASIDQQLSETQKLIWEKAKETQDLAKLEREILDSRISYRAIKTKLQEEQQKLSTAQETVRALVLRSDPFLEDYPTKAQIQELKSQHKIFKSLEESSQKLKQLEQELEFERKVFERFGQDLHQTLLEEKEVGLLLTGLESELKEKLGDQKASEKLTELSTLVRKLQDQWKADEEKLKLEQLKMKEVQGRLYNYEDHKKDLEVHFSQELLQTRTWAQSGEALHPETFTHFGHLDLNLQTGEELLIPLESRLENAERDLKREVIELRDQISQLTSQKESSEKRRDKITLLELKKTELLHAFNRLARLDNILGKDELRSFVLAMVEENLIHQTNKELELLCQGRYEIVHQTRGLKMAPEFYVLDKFREGSLRKISTLSGGETFMVSLAMALALAEMTRGQADIDSLFIDEGFGTLDQDSLTDVLEVLNHIQTRGFMVGIISHIKTLTQSLPVNLLLSKRSDGTSSVKLTYN